MVIGCYGFWGVKGRQRSPADAVHLQRALDALRVVGRQARGRGRVHARQLGVHRGPAFLASLGVQLGAHGGVGGGMSSRPVVSALKYSMVPPTSSGSRPRARISPIRRRASSTNSAAL
jgi:hypothetical protein